MRLIIHAASDTERLLTPAKRPSCLVSMSVLGFIRGSEVRPASRTYGWFVFGAACYVCAPPSPVTLYEVMVGGTFEMRMRCDHVLGENGQEILCWDASISQFVGFPTVGVRRLSRDPMASDFADIRLQPYSDRSGKAKKLTSQTALSAHQPTLLG